MLQREEICTLLFWEKKKNSCQTEKKSERKIRAHACTAHPVLNKHRYAPNTFGFQRYLSGLEALKQGRCVEPQYNGGISCSIKGCIFYYFIILLYKQKPVGTLAKTQSMRVRINACENLSSASSIVCIHFWLYSHICIYNHKHAQRKCTWTVDWHPTLPEHHKWQSVEPQCIKNDESWFITWHKNKRYLPSLLQQKHKYLTTHNGGLLRSSALKISIRIALLNQMSFRDISPWILI